MAKKKSAKASAKKSAATAVGKKSVAKKSVAKKAAPKAKSASKPAAKSAGKASSKAKGAKSAAKSGSKSASKGSGKVSALKTAGKKVGKVAKKVAQALKPVANNVVPFTRPTKSAATGSKKTSADELSSIFSPLDDRLIVEIEGAATRTAGGLFIPDTVEVTDRPQQGKVLAVGRGHRDKKGRLRPLDVQLGDMVLFERFLGSELNIGDRKLFVLRESQVLGIVRS